MATTMTVSQTQVNDTSEKFVNLELRTAYGPVYRKVSTKAPRDARSDEIPIIDLSGMNGTVEERKTLAREIKQASENTGFFYIKNHGVPEEIIENAYNAAKAFFKQPHHDKMKVSKKYSKHFNGYRTLGSSKASPSEGIDNRESLMWSYDPKYDPMWQEQNPLVVPEDIKPWLRGEDFVWDGTQHLLGFKDATLTYWQECLNLSRQLLKVFALALDLSEDYFENLTSMPGADGVFNFYPGCSSVEDIESSKQAGIGAHTDLQIMTLLFQDMLGGLQILSKEGRWINAPAIEGTFVVNIGDFLMRLTNDKMRSTVHRAFNQSTYDRCALLSYIQDEVCELIHLQNFDAVLLRFQFQ